jgi:hypothetical protein
MRCVFVNQMIVKNISEIYNRHEIESKVKFNLKKGLHLK